MNNEFFHAITLAYLLYFAIPSCVVLAVRIVLEKRDERENRKRLEELRAQEEAELARFKARLEAN